MWRCMVSFRQPSGRVNPGGLPIASSYVSGQTAYFWVGICALRNHVRIGNVLCLFARGPAGVGYADVNSTSAIGAVTPTIADGIF